MTKKIRLALASLTAASVALLGFVAPAAGQSAPVAAAPDLQVEPPAFLPDGKPTPQYSESHKKAHPNKRMSGVSAVPPAPSLQGKASAMAINGVDMRYAGMKQHSGSPTPIPNGILGANANFYCSSPYLDTRDYHTLMELAVQAGTNNGTQRGDVIEVGCTNDRVVNGGSDQTHLFVFAWKENVATVYNGGDFVDYGPNTVNAGSNIEALGWTNANATISRNFGIQYQAGNGPGQGNWWVAAFGNWIGYYPESAFSGGSFPYFAGVDQVQAFGEVAAGDDTATNPDNSTDPECTDMGTGGWAAHTNVQSPNAARIASLTYNYPAGYPTPLPLPVTTTFQTNNQYTVQAPSARSIWVGGPGKNSNGATAPNGSIGGC